MRYGLALLFITKLPCFEVYAIGYYSFDVILLCAQKWGTKNKSADLLNSIVVQLFVGTVRK